MHYKVTGLQSIWSRLTWRYSILTCSDFACVGYILAYLCRTLHQNPEFLHSVCCDWLRKQMHTHNTISFIMILFPLTIISFRWQYYMGPLQRFKYRWLRVHWHRCQCQVWLQSFCAAAHETKCHWSQLDEHAQWLLIHFFALYSNKRQWCSG